jgi:hypothetical protein
MVLQAGCTIQDAQSMERFSKTSALILKRCKIDLEAKRMIKAGWNRQEPTAKDLPAVKQFHFSNTRSLRSVADPGQFGHDRIAVITLDLQHAVLNCPPRRPVSFLIVSGAFRCLPLKAEDLLLS